MTTVAKGEALPQLPRFEHRLDLSRAATARELKTAPRHRWFYFPHSYSPRLINEVLDHWEFPKGGTLVDNFVGSGTTLLAARQRGLSAYGFDLSPLAVTVANTKIARYEKFQIDWALQDVLRSRTVTEYPKTARLSKAFTEEELKEIFNLLEPISQLQDTLRHFFLVALLWTARHFSRAVPDGGWFRWREWPNRSHEIRQGFEETVGRMTADVSALNWENDIPEVTASKADARSVPRLSGTADGVITSPPYANRHDYSRVFHIELLLLGLTEPSVTKLRHESIRSHVEARDPDGFSVSLESYRTPEALKTVLDSLPSDADPRIEPLLKGYFEDIYLSLLEVGRILRCGGRAAYVLGNVRHAGVMVPVDEITAELSSQAGLIFDAAWIMRLRGNSAQQMGQYGREPARETIVLMSKGFEQ